MSLIEENEGVPGAGRPRCLPVSTGTGRQMKWNAHTHTHFFNLPLSAFNNLITKTLCGLAGLGVLGSLYIIY